MKVHVVMMEDRKADFRYLLGVFSTGSKAESAADYELTRRRVTSMPGELTPKIIKLDLDEMTVDLNIEAIEELRHRR